jgi:Fe-S cluster assembly protein SufD
MSDAASPTGERERTLRAEGRLGLLAASLAEARREPRGEPSWLVARRAEALARLDASGFPSAADEAWRFTPLGPVLRVPFARGQAPVSAGIATPEPFPALDAHRAVLVNGAPVALTAAKGAPADRPSVDLRRISEVLATEPALLEPHLGRIAALTDGFVSQNTALFEDGLVVVVRPGERAHLSVLHVAAAGAGPTLATPRVLVIAEPGSDLLLIETHVSADGGQHLESSVVEVAVGTNAWVEHIRVQRGTSTSASVGTVAVRLGRDSRYVSRVFTFGGSLSRLDLGVTFEGSGAQCTLEGLYLAGDGDLVDHHTVVDHAHPRCSSRERYKGILDGSGTAVFDGSIFVRRGADRTEAHQENRNLLLSDDAVIHTKPELQIDTDDVKCSHGATVGRLDPAQLFYLRSRGMDVEVARALLTYAFAREAASGVTEEVTRRGLEDLIANALPSGAIAREFA